MPPKHARIEFRAFCRAATHDQLTEIIRREEEGAKRDPDREIYHEIALSELVARCRVSARE